MILHLLLTCILSGPKYFSNVSFNKTQLYQSDSEWQCNQNCAIRGDELAKPKHRKRRRHGNHRSVRAAHPNPCTAAWVGFAAYVHLYVLQFSKSTTGAPAGWLVHVYENCSHIPTAVRPSWTLCMWAVLQLWVIILPTFICSFPLWKESAFIHERKK